MINPTLSAGRNRHSQNVSETSPAVASPAAELLHRVTASIGVQLKNPRIPYTGGALVAAGTTAGFAPFVALGLGMVAVYGIANIRHSNQVPLQIMRTTVYTFLGYATQKIVVKIIDAAVL